MAFGFSTYAARLLGREREVEHVLGLLRSDGVRLLSVTGPGGVGKTRLAIEVADQLAAGLRHGAVLVDLAAVDDPDDVASAIAGAVEVSRSAPERPVTAVCRALRHRDLLLVLDNFEQVVSAASVVVELVERCPGVRVLVTSRTPLRVRAERVVHLAALPLPVGASAVEVADVEGFASVQLFCERATAVQPGFALSDQNASAVAAICRAADGLPLAIELAAARTTHLPPAVLAGRLAAGASGAALDAFGRGPADLPARQRTLRAAIAWSYDLLGPHEQRLLTRLSTFDGSCSLEAIEAVCGDPATGPAPDVALAGAALLDALAALVDLHLVEPDQSQVDEARFRMLVTIREFAREQVVDAGERHELRARHARHYVALVQEAAAGLESPAEQAWSRRLERDAAELGSALRHLLATDDVISGLRMVTDAGEYWCHSGRVVEGRQWLDELYGRAGDDLPTRDRAAALIWMAQMGMDENALGGPGPAPAPFARLEEALGLAREVRDHRLELRALSCLSHVLTVGDDVERPVKFAEEGMARSAELGERWWLGELQLRAAVLAHWNADSERAAALAVAARDLADEIGHQRLAIECRMTLAFVAPRTARAGDVPQLADVLPLAEDLGDRRTLAWFYPAVAAEALVAGRVSDAARWFRAGLETARDLGFRRAGGLGILGAQDVAIRRGQWEGAARLFGALRGIEPMLRTATPPRRLQALERAARRLREALGDAAFEANVRTGERLSWDDALEQAIAACRVVDGDEDEEAAVVRLRPLRRGRHGDTQLTERELEVLRCIAAGDSNKDVAASLGITPKTVMHHSMAIYRKLGVRGRAEATAHAFRHGLHEPPQHP